MSRPSSLPHFVTHPLVRSKRAIRFLARHRIWGRKADIASLNDCDFSALIRTSGLERDTQLALAEEAA